MSGGAPTDFLYYNARTLFATAQINWTVAAVNAMLVSSGYSPQLTHKYVSDVTPAAIIIRDLALTTLGVTNGICFGTIPEVASVTSVYTVAAVILYIKTSADTTSPLVYYSSTGPGFPFAIQGFDYTVGFDQTAGGFFQV